jgi:hypothetical protein
MAYRDFHLADSRYQKFLTPLRSQHKVSAVPPPKSIICPNGADLLLSKVSG